VVCEKSGQLCKRIDPLKKETTVLTNRLSRVSGDRLSWT